MSRLEILFADVVEVGNKNFMVNERPHVSWPHVVNTVKVRNVDGTSIRSWILLVVLVDIKTE